MQNLLSVIYKGVVLTVFFDMEGQLPLDFISRNDTISGNHYCYLGPRGCNPMWPTEFRIKQMLCMQPGLIMRCLYRGTGEVLKGHTFTLDSDM
jgi:hypothetical protein